MKSWYRATQPLDQPANQVIEVRRAFYSGVTVAVNNPEILVLMATDPAGMNDELREFFEGEVQDGHGIPGHDL